MSVCLKTATNRNTQENSHLDKAGYINPVNRIVLKIFYRRSAIIIIVLCSTTLCMVTIHLYLEHVWVYMPYTRMKPHYATFQFVSQPSVTLWNQQACNRNYSNLMQCYRPASDSVITAKSVSVSNIANALIFQITTISGTNFASVNMRANGFGALGPVLKAETEGKESDSICLTHYMLVCRYWYFWDHDMATTCGAPQKAQPSHVVISWQPL